MKAPSSPKRFGVHHPVVRLVRLAQAGKFVRMGAPVELAAVHNGSAHRGGVAVHVLGGGVGYDVGPPFQGAAQHRCGEGVVHDQRHAVGMGRRRKALDVQNGQRRIGNGLAEHALGIGAESRLQLLIGAIGDPRRCTPAPYDPWCGPAGCKCRRRWPRMPPRDRLHRQC